MRLFERRCDSSPDIVEHLSACGEHVVENPEIPAGDPQSVEIFCVRGIPAHFPGVPEDPDRMAKHCGGTGCIPQELRESLIPKPVIPLSTGRRLIGDFQETLDPIPGDRRAVGFIV